MASRQGMALSYLFHLEFPFPPELQPSSTQGMITTSRISLSHVNLREEVGRRRLPLALRQCLPRNPASSGEKFNGQDEKRYSPWTIIPGRGGIPPQVRKGPEESDLPFSANWLISVGFQAASALVRLPILPRFECQDSEAVCQPRLVCK